MPTPRAVRLPALCALLATACLTPTRPPPAAGDGTGRERVRRVLAADAPGAGSSRLRGIVDTLWSSGRRLGRRFAPRDAIPFDERLEDGTVVGGLLFPYEPPDGGPAPLWMTGFGLLQHRRGTEASKFHELYLARDPRRVRAHVAILDHPTSAPFLEHNGHLSMGAYDDARMWMELVPILRRRVPVTTVHLLGVSMSGQTVVHAMLEDRRRHAHRFASGIALSIAPDFRRAPGGQFALLPTPPGTRNPWTPDPNAGTAPFERWLQAASLRVLVEEQFAGPEPLAPADPARFFRACFDRRIAFLREHHRHDPTWNPAVATTDLDAYLRSTRIAEVIGRVRSPLVLVSARDDPAVSRDQFAEVAAACRDNGWVVVHETTGGGHFAFELAYGPGWLAELMRLLADPGVLRDWIHEHPAR